MQYVHGRLHVGLSISKIAATLKACAPALMQQEDRFLDLVKQVQRFELTRDGALILRTGGRGTITARRS